MLSFLRFFCRDRKTQTAALQPLNDVPPTKAGQETAAENQPDGSSNLHRDGVPGTIQQLLAIQELQPAIYGPVAKADDASSKVQAVLEQVMALSTSPCDDQQIALALIGRLEALHQAVVRELQADHGASRPLISRWSVDADRLLHARNMLSNVDLG